MLTTSNWPTIRIVRHHTQYNSSEINHTHRTGLAACMHKSSTNIMEGGRGGYMANEKYHHFNYTLVQAHTPMPILKWGLELISSQILSWDWKNPIPLNQSCNQACFSYTMLSYTIVSVPKLAIRISPKKSKLKHKIYKESTTQNIQFTFLSNYGAIIKS